MSLLAWIQVFSKSGKYPLPTEPCCINQFILSQYLPCPRLCAGAWKNIDKDNCSTKNLYEEPAEQDYKTSPITEAKQVTLEIKHSCD